MSERELLKQAIKEQNIRAIVKYVFPNLDFEPTKIQYLIIKIIAFRIHKRVCINAMTRWGKTQAVAIGVCLFILFNENKKVALIGPRQEQAGILRDYLADLIIGSAFMLEVVELDAEGAGKLRKEASKKRQTFKNGCEYRVFSAEGEANRLMGFGVNGIVIKDESCLIDPRAESKISRMLGDAPDEVILVELANPWDRATAYYKHWTSEEYFKIHVDWRVALEEGRTTLEFIESQKRDLNPLDFTVLYESDFPLEAEDSIFNYAHILKSFRELPSHLKDFPTSLMGLDIAAMGADFTVAVMGFKYGELYVVKRVEFWGKEDPMVTVAKVQKLVREHGVKRVNIDVCGMGTPVYSRLKEVKDENWDVVGCNFGAKSEVVDITTNIKEFTNMKAEQYFRLQAIFQNGNIIILDQRDRIKEQLLQMKWKPKSGTESKQVIDPPKSPDFADALVYFTWKEKGIVIDFG